MAQLTPTGQHLQQKRNFSDGAWAVPSCAVGHPTFVPRLAFKVVPKMRADYRSLSATLSWADAVYYCDSSALDMRIDLDLWRAILDGPGRIVLIDWVVEESAGWMRDHKTHPLVVAFAHRHPRVELRKVSELDEITKVAFDYYVALLVARRTPLKGARGRFEREHGRPPNAEEEQHLRAEIQRDLGVRGAVLAGKQGRSGLFTDEALVFLATEEAIRTGRQVAILAQDGDIEDQFFKLIWFLDTHYRGMMLADWYLKQFGSFKLHAIPTKLVQNNIFNFENGVLFEYSPNLLHELLPPRFRFVPITCLNIGSYFSQLIFGAEQELGQVLAVKGGTGGLSTNKLGGRNIHPWLAPLPIESNLHNCGAVVDDVRLPLPGSTAMLSRLDIAQAIGNFERHTSMVAEEARDRMIEGLPISRSVFRFMPGSRRSSRPPIPGPGGILLPFETPGSVLAEIGRASAAAT